MKISVIVPVYNEEKAVAETLRSVYSVLKSFEEFEIIAVNDGSSDGSLAEIQKAKAEIPGLKIISHAENLGYGKSLYDGIEVAQHGCIGIIDADGSYPVEDLKKLCQYYPDFDMVVGARTGTEYTRGLFKRPARLVFKFLAEYAAGRGIPDINSGLRVFRRDLILKYKDSLCAGFSFTTTITLIFMLNKYCVKYVPIEYLVREGKSKVHHFKDTLRTLQIITQSVLQFNPIKLFLLIAFINAVFGLGIIAINWAASGPSELSVLGAIMTGSFIPVFCLGLIADLLRRIPKT